MMRGISIEIKMIVGVIFFALLLGGVERYEFSQNIVQQFLESKKGKNQLLIDTISPVIGLNISLGLEDANKEYLTQIVDQNPDLMSFELTGADGETLYSQSKGNFPKISEKIDGVYHAVQDIKDPVTGEKIATVSLYFDDHEYRAILQKNQEVSIKILAIALLVLVGFIAYIRSEFRFLKQLSDHVLQYDPKLNNFALAPTERKDEVGIIHNAIIMMVQKNHTFAAVLDEMNQSLAAKVEERTLELQKANSRLQELSTTDPLTLLPNRRHLESHLHDIWELAKRNSVSVGIIMCDIDYFKKINDHHGHLAGDIVLKEVAHAIKLSLKRSSDFIARYGGEEFIIVLYDADVSAAEGLCVNIQNNIKTMNHEGCPNLQLDSITLSFGIGCGIPAEASQYNDLVDLADRALYKAKESGRNRFVTFVN